MLRAKLNMQHESRNWSILVLSILLLVALALSSCGSDSCSEDNYLAGRWDKTDVPWEFEFRCDGTIRGWYGGESRGEIGTYRMVDATHVHLEFYDTGTKAVYTLVSSSANHLVLDGPGTSILTLRRLR